MDNLKEQMQELITSIRQAAEMMQGCTNHSAYAEINTKQILSIIEQAGYYPIQADSEGLVDICNVLCGGQCADNIELKLCAKFSTKQLEDINNLLKAQKALDDKRIEQINSTDKIEIFIDGKKTVFVREGKKRKK